MYILIAGFVLSCAVSMINSLKPDKVFMIFFVYRAEVSNFKILIHYISIAYIAFYITFQLHLHYTRDD